MAHDTYCESVLKWGIYPWSYGHKRGKSRGNMMMPTVDPDFLFPHVFIWCSHLWDHPVIPIPIITITTCPRNAADRTWHNSRRFLGRPIHVGCCDGKSGLKVFHNKMWISTILTKSGLVTRLKYFNMLKYLLTYLLTYLKMDISDIGPLLVIGGIVVICHVSIEPWDWRVHKWMLTRPRVEDSKIWIGLSETMLPENPMVWQQVDICHFWIGLTYSNGREVHLYAIFCWFPTGCLPPPSHPTGSTRSAGIAMHRHGLRWMDIYPPTIGIQWAWLRM